MTTPKIAHSPGGIHGPTRVHNTNGTTIGSAVFVGLTLGSNGQTGTQTERSRYTDSKKLAATAAAAGERVTRALADCCR